MRGAECNNSPRLNPYRTGLVEWIEDFPTDKNLNLLTNEAKKMLIDVVNFSSILTNQEIALPDDFPISPLEISYWIAGNLYGVALEQQALLETQDTEERLEREIEILQSTSRHLEERLKDPNNFSS